MAKSPLHSSNNDLTVGASNPGLSRRKFLGTLAAGIAGSLLLSPEEVYAKAFGERRQLSFLNLHTNEQFKVVCCPDRRPDATTLHRFNEFLRDHRTDQIHTMDAGLLDILTAVTALTNSRGTVQVVCGYRSPETNAFLHQRGVGVAENSLHMVGKAIDIRLSDVSSKMIQRAGIALQRGGVGYYRQSDFVHLDTGRFRTW
ncbi:YcbK family protein [Methylogaea oryzae]|uniref:Murein endopeptidase K n=1 Tax=Methylogaea oryzae TaxID=1295382 RepID=A0A8D5AND6_9GAMM|nr:DUF882 domain-containing protein [Methylogaea oryzae]BBL71985.1 twin-arginine translocation pathway signal [Methylogaea oryzae]